MHCRKYIFIVIMLLWASTWFSESLTVLNYNSHSALAMAMQYDPEMNGSDYEGDKSPSQLISGLGYLSNDDQLRSRETILKADEDEKAVIHETLLNKLNSEDDSAALRQCMVYLCGFGPNKETADAFVRILNSQKDRADRKLAAIFLGKVGSEDNLDALLQAIREDQGQLGHGRNIASSAYGSIGNIGGEKAADILLNLWYSKEYVPDHSLYSIARTGSPKVLDLILDILEQKEHRFRHNAAAGLAAFAGQNRDNTEMSERLLVLLRKYARDDDPKIRKGVLDAFFSIGQAEDIPLMIALTNDPYHQIVNYTEDGIVKEKTIYPIKDDADWAIAKINNNMANALKENSTRDTDHKKDIIVLISKLWTAIKVNYPEDVRVLGPSEVFSNENVDVNKWMTSQLEHEQQFKSKRLDTSQLIAIQIHGKKAVALSEIRENVMVYVLSRNDEKWILNRMQLQAIGESLDLEQFIASCFESHKQEK